MGSLTPMLVVHGGAWYWDDSLDEIKREGLIAALSAGYQILKGGGSALDAVEHSVISLENNPVFDAGTGGYINRNGVVQLDALIVDGLSMDFGAVAAVSRVRNPISLARMVMERTPHCFFVGEGADLLAGDLGVEIIANLDLQTEAMRQFYEAARGEHDTVGAVAMDSKGNFACATSTSGSPTKPHGRVGDSPLYGSGGYAENGVGAAGATGNGENIMRLLLAKRACESVAEGHSASEAVAKSLRYADSRYTDSMCGLIMIDQIGKPAIGHTTPKLAAGWVGTDGSMKTAMHMREFQL